MSDVETRAEILRYLRLAAHGRGLVLDEASLAAMVDAIAAGLVVAPPFTGGQVKRIAALIHPQRQTAASGV